MIEPEGPDAPDIRPAPSPPDAELLRLAEAIAEGRELEWSDIARGLPPEHQGEVESLRTLAEIARAHRRIQELGTEPETVSPGAARSTENTIPLGIWGEFELLEQVGAGASADVYRARDAKLDRQVALKLLRRGELDAEGRERVLREGRLLARVRHENVATVYGAAEHDGRVGFALQFVRGKTLHELVRSEGARGANEAAQIGLDLCRALAAVHDKGVLHRDIKAQNVMREEGGRMLLVDFGIGLDLAESAPHAATLSGTPLYLAPEVFAGQPATVQSDLYSLGVLLFFLVTGKFPVSGNSVAELRQKHQRAQATLLRDLRPDLPGAFVEVVERALAHDSGERFKTAGQMERALADVLRRPTAEITPLVATRGLRRWLPWAGVAALALLFSIAWANWLSPTARAKRLVREAEELHGDSKTDQAVAKAGEAVQVAADYPEAQALLGRLLITEGDIEIGQDHLRRAEELTRLLDDGSRKASIECNLFLHVLRYEDAVEACIKAATLDEDDATSARLAAMISAFLNKYDEAVDWQGLAFERDPDVLNRGELGILRSIAGEPRAALQLLADGRAQRTKAGDETYYYWGEGFAQLMLGNAAAAEQAFGRMERGADRFALNGQTLRASALVYLGRLREAADQLMAVQTATKQRETAEYWRATSRLASLWRASGDDATANKLAQELAQIPKRPLNLKALRSSALTQIAVGQLILAQGSLEHLEWLSANFSGKFSRAVSLQVRGELELAHGNDSIALDFLRQAVNEFRDGPNLNSLARALAQQGLCKDSLVLFREVIEQRKGILFEDYFATDWILPHLDLARCEAQVGQLAEAKQHYDTFLGFWGENAREIPLVRAARAERDQLDAQQNHTSRGNP